MAVFSNVYSLSVLSCKWEKSKRELSKSVWATQTGGDRDLQFRITKAQSDTISSFNIRRINWYFLQIYEVFNVSRSALIFQYLLILDKYNNAKLRWFTYWSWSVRPSTCVCVCVWSYLVYLYWFHSMFFAGDCPYLCQSCVCERVFMNPLLFVFLRLLLLHVGHTYYLWFKHQSTVILSYLISCRFLPITKIAVWQNDVLNTLVSCFRVCGSYSPKVLVT